jgi:hypothetical protein
MKNYIFNLFKDLFILLLEEEFDKKLHTARGKKIIDPNLSEFKNVKIFLKKDEKDGIYFHISKQCWSVGVSRFSMKAPFSGVSVLLDTSYYDNGVRNQRSCEATESQEKFLLAIFSVPGVAGVQAYTSYQLRITKSAALSWEEMLPKIFEVINDFFATEID